MGWKLSRREAVQKADDDAGFVDVAGADFGGDIATVELTATAREASSSGPGAPISEAADNGSGMATVFADGAGTSDSQRDARFTAREDFRVMEQPIDLEVDLQVSNTSPQVGFDEYTVTVTVANQGPAMLLAWRSMSRCRMARGAIRIPVAVPGT